MRGASSIPREFGKNDTAFPMRSRSFDPYHRWLGIPPKDHPPDHYRLLGIERFESNSEVISDAADRQMAHLRSHQLGQYAAYSQRILNEVAAARVLLLDPQKKADYDAQLRRNAAAQAHAVAVSAATGPAPAAPAAPAASRPLTAVPSASIPPAVFSSAAGGPQIQSYTRTHLAARRKRSSAVPALFALIAGFAVVGGFVWAAMHSQRRPPGQPPIARQNPEPARSTTQPADSVRRPEASDSPHARTSAVQPGEDAPPRPEPVNRRLPRQPAQSAGRDARFMHTTAPGEMEQTPDRFPHQVQVDQEQAVASRQPHANDRSLADLLDRAPSRETGGPAFSSAPGSGPDIWEWQLHRANVVRLKFYPDGTASLYDEDEGNPDFRWSRNGDHLTLQWPPGRIDTMTVSPDGHSCFGRTNTGRKVIGRRVSNQWSNYGPNGP